MQDFGLSHLKKHLAMGLSGGERRRLEIARGLMHHPDVLFLDEPTLGLDAQTRRYIWEYIQNMNRSEGVTVVITTHYMEEAQKVCKKVAVIDSGRVLAKGTLEEVMSAHEECENLEDVFLKLTGRTLRE